MTESTEREMVRRLDAEPRPTERFTSLQPTYEDSVPPDSGAWGDDQDWNDAS